MIPQFRFWHRKLKKIFPVAKLDFVQEIIYFQVGDSQWTEFSNGALLPIIQNLTICGLPVTIGDIFCFSEIGPNERYCFVSNTDYPTYYEIRNIETGDCHEAEYFHCQIQEEYNLKFVIDRSGNVKNVFSHPQGVNDRIFRVMGVER